MIKFPELNFGAPAAERDINQGLKDYFVESDAFRRVYAREKYVILGNRGSGKSAIFKMIAERERESGTLVIELSPEDYSYEMLSSIMVGETEGSWAKQGAYAAAWKYLIYVLIMKGLIKQGPSFKRGAAAQIYNYLRDNHSGHQDNPIGLLISYLKRIEGLKVGTFEASIKTKELVKLYKLEDIHKLLPALKELCEKRRVVVLIDELDRGWDASEDARSFVAGLFQAAISINEHTPNMRVLISLRRELYDSIPSLYEDAQKYRDVMEVISWDEPSLLQLVANRIRHTVRSLASCNNIECWNSVFAETLDYRQTKSFNYFVDRTLYRPREIIQFCTDSLEESRKSKFWPINYPVISKSELVYSEHRTKDIAAEYRFQHPGLMSIFEVFRGRSYSFDREELEFLCLGINTGEYVVDGAARWVLEQEPEYLIENLWRIGFLRAQAVGGVKALRRSGSQYLGPHQVSNLNLRNVPRFQVHPMFRSYLGLKEAKETSQQENINGSSE
jgi:energy-coupling factor transporter ATP-binding protein EcfA2